MIKTRNWWFNVSTSILIKCKFKKDCSRYTSSMIRSINVPCHSNDSPPHTAGSFRPPFPCSLLQKTRALQQLRLLGSAIAHMDPNGVSLSFQLTFIKWEKTNYRWGTLEPCWCNVFHCLGIFFVREKNLRIELERLKNNWFINFTLRPVWKWPFQSRVFFFLLSVDDRQEWV